MGALHKSRPVFDGSHWVFYFTRRTELRPQSQTLVVVSSATFCRFRQMPLSPEENFPMRHLEQEIINLKTNTVFSVVMLALDTQLRLLQKQLVEVHYSVPTL